MRSSISTSPDNITWKAFARALRPTLPRASPKNNHCTRKLSEEPAVYQLRSGKGKKLLAPKSATPAVGRLCISDTGGGLMSSRFSFFCFFFRVGVCFMCLSCSLAACTLPLLYYCFAPSLLFDPFFFFFFSRICCFVARPFFSFNPSFSCVCCCHPPLFFQYFFVSCIGHCRAPFLFVSSIFFAFLSQSVPLWQHRIVRVLPRKHEREAAGPRSRWPQQPREHLLHEQVRGHGSLNDLQVSL